MSLLKKLFGGNDALHDLIANALRDGFAADVLASGRPLRIGGQRLDRR